MDGDNSIVSFSPNEKSKLDIPSNKKKSLLTTFFNENKNTSPPDNKNRSISPTNLISNTPIIERLQSHIPKDADSGFRSQFADNISHIKRFHVPLFGVTAKVRNQSTLLRTCHVRAWRISLSNHFISKLNPSSSMFDRIQSSGPPTIAISMRIRGQQKDKVLISKPISLNIIDESEVIDFPLNLYYTMEYLHHLKGLSDILLIKLLHVKKNGFKSFSLKQIELSTVLQQSLSGDLEFFDNKGVLIASLNLHISSELGKCIEINPDISLYDDKKEESNEEESMTNQFKSKISEMKISSQQIFDNLKKRWIKNKTNEKEEKKTDEDEIVNDSLNYDVESQFIYNNQNLGQSVFSDTDIFESDSSEDYKKNDEIIYSNNKQVVLSDQLSNLFSLTTNFLYVLFIDTRCSHGIQLLDWADHTDSSLHRVCISINSEEELSHAFKSISTNFKKRITSSKKKSNSLPLYIGIAAPDDFVSRFMVNYVNLVTSEPRKWEDFKLFVIPLNSILDENSIKILNNETNLEIENSHCYCKSNFISQYLAKKSSNYRSLFFCSDWYNAFDGISRWIPPTGKMVEDNINRYFSNGYNCIKFPISNVVFDHFIGSSVDETQQEIVPFIRDLFVGQTPPFGPLKKINNENSRINLHIEYWKKNKGKKSSMNYDIQHLHITRRFFLNSPIDNEISEEEDLFFTLQFDKERLISYFTGKNDLSTYEAAIEQLVCFSPQDENGKPCFGFQIYLDGVCYENVTFLSVSSSCSARIKSLPVTII